jgi:hypothetical protein
MRMEIAPYTLSTGTAVEMSVTVTEDNGLRNEDGQARLDYWLYSSNDAVVTSGNVNVNGDFCKGWDGSVNAAFVFIANYLGVVLI